MKKILTITVIVFSILITLAGCFNSDRILLHDDVEFLPIGVMNSLDWQHSTNRFAGTRSGEEITEVYVYDLETDEYLLVSHSTSSTLNIDPEWSPTDETLLLFRSNAEFGEETLIGIVDLKDFSKKTIANGSLPEWMPSGNKIIYKNDKGNIVSHELSTGAELVIVIPEIGESSKITELSVSPDGKYLAYSVEFPNNENQIFVATLDMKGFVKETLLISQGYILDYLDWSANSSNIVFQRLSPDGPPEIVAYDIIDRCITDPLKIGGVELRGYSRLEWSLDNSKLFTGGKVGKSFGLVIIQIDGSHISDWLASGDCGK